MTRWLLALALALVVGPAVAQVADTSSPSVRVLTLTYKGDQPHDEPWIGIMPDGTGNARVIFAAGHGGMLFMTRDNIGYVVVGQDDRVGRQEDMLSFMVGGDAEGRFNRAMFERLARQQLAIAPAGTEQVAGVEGRIYRLTLTGGGEAPHSFEFVISTDSRLAPAGREILRFYDQFRAPVLAVTGTEPQPLSAVRGLLASGTPLRVGPHYRLREIETRTIPASYFALPGPVLTRGQLFAELRDAGLAATTGGVDPDGTVNGTVMAEPGDTNVFQVDNATNPH